MKELASVDARAESLLYSVAAEEFLTAIKSVVTANTPLPFGVSPWMLTTPFELTVSE